MNFTKELKNLAMHQNNLEKAQEGVARRFEIEIKKMLAKYKIYELEFYSGNGTWFFSRKGVALKDWRDEDKLPKELLDLYEFLQDNDYILGYISNIKLGDNLERQQAS